MEDAYSPETSVSYQKIMKILRNSENNGESRTTDRLRDKYNKDIREG
jgi:hypothetical protein